MTEHQPGYFKRVLTALLGRKAPESAPSGETSGPDALALQSEAARLRMELAEREERIAKVQAEYKRLQAAKDHAEESAGDVELDRFYEKVSKPLSNLAALADAAEQGQAVTAQDLLQLAGTLLKVFDRAGLRRIGKVGEATVFSSALHRRMSGGDVDEGMAVTVCVPGFQTDRAVALKALVKSGEAE